VRVKSRAQLHSQFPDSCVPRSCAQLSEGADPSLPRPEVQLRAVMDVPTARLMTRS
jgi:hypothetical protein